MNLDPSIFKAYDIRGVYPGEVNEETARAIGAAFVAYLHAKRIAVGRDMRLSSPAIAAAFIEGATSHGADVVDYGMIATDMLYFAVARGGHDGGVEITASHNPGQHKRHEAGPPGSGSTCGDAGISDIRT
jgi:phosphomannomutase